MWLIFNYKDMYEGLTSNVRTLKGKTKGKTKDFPIG